MYQCTSGSKLKSLNNLIKFTELISYKVSLYNSRVENFDLFCLFGGTEKPKIHQLLLAIDRNTALFQAHFARFLWAHWWCRNCGHEHMPTECVSAPLGAMFSAKHCH